MSQFDRQELAAIFAGGAIGAVARVWLARNFVQADTSWPWTIFLVNLAGAFALGYFATRLQERLPLSTYRRPFLGTGVCGGLTTFSTMQVELLKILDHRHYGIAAGYAVLSVVGGYLAIHLASALVRRVRAVA